MIKVIELINHKIAKNFLLFVIVVFFCSGCLYFLSDEAAINRASNRLDKYLKAHPEIDGWA